MKFKINAGAEVDVLTRDELKDELTAQTAVLTGGVQYRYVSVGSSPTPGALLFEFSPENGYVWDVQTISVLKSGPGVLRVSLNEDSPSNFIAHIPDDASNGNSLIVSSKSLIVPAQTTLQVRTIGAFVGTGACRILVKEVFAMEQWRL